MRAFRLGIATTALSLIAAYAPAPARAVGPYIEMSWTVTHAAGSPAVGDQAAVGDVLSVAAWSSDGAAPSAGCQFSVQVYTQNPLGLERRTAAAVLLNADATAATDVRPPSCGFSMTIPPFQEGIAPDRTAGVVRAIAVMPMFWAVDGVYRDLDPALYGRPWTGTAAPQSPHSLAFFLVPGGEHQPFTSVPWSLSWYPGDWYDGYRPFAFNEPYRLEAPVSGSACNFVLGFWDIQIALPADQSGDCTGTVTMPGPLPPGMASEVASAGYSLSRVNYRATNGQILYAWWTEAPTLVAPTVEMSASHPVLWPRDMQSVRYVPVGGRWQNTFHLDPALDVPNDAYCSIVFGEYQAWASANPTVPRVPGTFYPMVPMDSNGDCFFDLVNPNPLGFVDTFGMSGGSPTVGMDFVSLAGRVTTIEPVTPPAISVPIATPTDGSLVDLSTSTDPSSNSGSLAAITTISSNSDLSVSQGNPIALAAAKAAVSVGALAATSCSSSTLSPSLAIGGSGGLKPTQTVCSRAVDGTYLASVLKVDGTGASIGVAKRFQLSGQVVRLIDAWVGQTPTAISISSPDTSIAGESQGISGTVRATNALRGAATGKVVVSGDATTCTAVLDAEGAFSCSLPWSLTGLRPLTVSYGGSASYQPSVISPGHRVVFVGAPVSVSATAGDRVATVRWLPPTLQGATPLDAYVVDWSGGSVTLPTTSRSFTVPDLTNGTAYSLSVRAVTADGSSPASFAAEVTPSGPPGNFTIAPTSGSVGTSVTLTGTNLRNVRSVTFNGSAARFAWNSTGTALYTSVPSGARSGKILVSTWSGDVSSGVSFTLKSGSTGPTISSLGSAAGPAGTRVTVTGSNLAGATSVKFAGTEASFVVLGPGTLVAVIPTAVPGTVGKITIVSDGGSATSKAGFTVTPATYRLRMSVGGSGSITTSPPMLTCGKSTCGADIPYGTLLSIAATPASGSVFTGWSGACTGTGTCSVAMTADKTVGTTFKLVTSLDYSGATTAQRSTTMAAGAYLKANGYPVIGAPVAFTFNGATYTAVTDWGGYASVALPTPTRPKTYSLVITYGGDPGRLSKSITQSIVVT